MAFLSASTLVRVAAVIAVLRESADVAAVATTLALAGPIAGGAKGAGAAGVAFASAVAAGAVVAAREPALATVVVRVQIGLTAVGRIAIAVGESRGAALEVALAILVAEDIARVREPDRAIDAARPTASGLFAPTVTGSATARLVVST